MTANIVIVCSVDNYFLGYQLSAWAMASSVEWAQIVKLHSASIHSHHRLSSETTSLFSESRESVLCAQVCFVCDSARACARQYFCARVRCGLVLAPETQRDEARVPKREINRDSEGGEEERVRVCSCACVRVCVCRGCKLAL